MKEENSFNPSACALIFAQIKINICPYPIQPFDPLGGNSSKDHAAVRNAQGLHQLAHTAQGDLLASSIITPPAESILDPVNNTPVGYVRD